MSAPGLTGAVCPGTGGPALVFPALEFVPNFALDTHPSFGLGAVPGGDLVPRFSRPGLRSSRMTRPAAVTGPEPRALSGVGSGACVLATAWGRASERSRAGGPAGSRRTRRCNSPSRSARQRRRLVPCQKPKRFPSVSPASSAIFSHVGFFLSLSFKKTFMISPCEGQA